MHSETADAGRASTRWHPQVDDRALHEAAQAIILGAAAQSIRARGSFHLVLAGGNTPRAVYRALASAAADWAAWHIYFGDERCLPAADPERNSTMASETWLSRVPIPAAAIHCIPAELGAEKAARCYTRTLDEAGIDDFDLVLLGLGEDGHTASLFPGHARGTPPLDGAAVPTVLPVFDAPKPPPQRVSLSAGRLSRARRVIFLVSGDAKRAAVHAWRAGEELPAGSIQPQGGVDVLLTAALL